MRVLMDYGVGRAMLALFLLGGCTGLKPESPIPVYELSSPTYKLSAPSPNFLEPEPGDSELLLQYYRGLHSMSEAELQRELEQAWQTTAKEPTAFDRLQLILLLSLPEVPFQDLEQARAMLRSFLKTELEGVKEYEGAKGLYDLALFLQGFLMEEAQQKRRYRLLQEQLEQKQEQVKRLRSGLKYLDGRRKQEQEWAHSLEQQLENERGRAETLEQKLEALKTIEKRLEYRNQSQENLQLPEQKNESNN